MARPGVAVGATVLAAAVRIDAVAKRNIGAVVFGDQALRNVGEKLRGNSPVVGRGRFLVLKLLPIVLQAHRFKSIKRGNLRTATDNALVWLLRLHSDHRL